MIYKKIGVKASMMTEKAKATMLRYRKNAREQIQVDMAKGMKAKIRAYADKSGVSMSALIMQLLESEMSKDAEFCAEWAAKVEAEQAEAEQVRQAEVDAIRASMKPPAAK